jgi:phenylacetate-CoA ligase
MTEAAGGARVPERPWGVIEELDVTLFVPCYNEELQIVNTLETASAAAQEVGCTWEIIVVDDASTDRTVPLVEAWLAAHPGLPVRLIRRERNKGLAYNYVDAAFYGRGRWYRVVHGDNPEPRETMVKHLREMGAADLILTYPVRVERRTLARRFISRLYTRVVNLATGFDLRYWNGTTLLSRYDVMRWHSYATGFGFFADTLANLLWEGRTYKEIGGVYQEQSGRKSKAFKPKNMISVIHSTLSLFLRRIGRRVVR